MAVSRRRLSGPPLEVADIEVEDAVRIQSTQASVGQPAGEVAGGGRPLKRVRDVEQGKLELDALGRRFAAAPQEGVAGYANARSTKPDVKPSGRVESDTIGDRPDDHYIAAIRSGVIHAGIRNVPLRGEGERHSGFGLGQGGGEESVIQRFADNFPLQRDLDALDGRRSLFSTWPVIVGGMPSSAPHSWVNVERGPPDRRAVLGFAALCVGPP
jgi:hypothetical protein